MVVSQALIAMPPEVPSSIEFTDLLLSKADDVVQRSASEQEKWLLEVSGVLRGWDSLYDLTILQEAKILYTVYSKWEPEDGIATGSFLSREVTAKWGYSFHDWACNSTKRRARSQSKITINNKITVYRDWIAERNIEYPKTVYVPKRDVYGEIVNPKDAFNEQDVWEEIEFHPETCDFSKLLVARGAARAGQMTDLAWTALADPYATVEELKKAIAGEKEEEKEAQLQLFQDSGILYAKEGSTIVGFMSFLFENSEHPLAKKAYLHLMRMLGVDCSDIPCEPDRSNLPLAEFIDGKLIINRDGCRFAEFSQDEVLTLVSVCQTDSLLSEAKVECDTLRAEVEQLKQEVNASDPDIFLRDIWALVGQPEARIELRNGQEHTVYASLRDTLREALAERDALRVEVERLRKALAEIADLRSKVGATYFAHNALDDVARIARGVAGPHVDEY